MESDLSIHRRADAALEFEHHEDRHDGAEIVARLTSGLNVLRDALFVRLHEEVEKKVGMDSMLAPISAEKTEKLAKLEIDLYQIAVSAVAVGQRHYVSSSDEWYLRWLTRCRLGRLESDAKVAKRLTSYVSKPPDGRRLAFTNVLAEVVPESRRAPLVLFRLMPMAVEIATAMAFNDRVAAAEVRNRQTDCLPAVEDCHECHGKLLENGQQCPQCGNPCGSSTG
jgi:hypothetical protein